MWRRAPFLPPLALVTSLATAPGLAIPAGTIPAGGIPSGTTIPGPATGAPGAASPPRPQRIMSLNLCTDELLLDLVAPARITSLTFLSRTPSTLAQWPQAAGLPVNHAQAEEVLAQHPDLVLAGTFTPPAILGLLHRLRIPLVVVAPATNFAQIRAQTRLVAHAVGEEARGEALLAHMDATLATLARTAPPRVIRVAGWGGGGEVPGRGTLFDTILRAAGGVNIAAGDGPGDGRFDLEALLTSRPDVLAYGADDSATPSLRTDNDQHPLLLRLYGRRRIRYPEALYGCGVPESADAASALRTALLRAMNTPGDPP